jgi:hypothetical protein
LRPVIAVVTMDWRQFGSCDCWTDEATDEAVDVRVVVLKLI